MQLLKIFVIFLFIIWLISCSYKGNYVIYNNHNVKQKNLFLLEPKGYKKVATYHSYFTIESFLLNIDSYLKNISYSKKNTIVNLPFKKNHYTDKSFIIISVFYSKTNHKTYSKANETAKLIYTHLKTVSKFKNIHINSYDLLEGDDYQISILVK